MALLASCGASAQAQSSSVSIYGSIDQYFNHMSSSSGAKLNTLQDGKDLRSRLGFRGVEDLGGGLQAKFLLEMGLSANSGASADSTRAFDRQSWVGLAHAQYGELRLGRQNSAPFTKGDYTDFTARTLGSIINNFGVPARFDNDLAYMSPRWAGLQIEGHFAQQQASASGTQVSTPIVQLAADYLNGPTRVGYAGLVAKAPQNAALNANVFYHYTYANHDYGQGKLYAAYVRSNNVAATANGNNAGSVLSNVGGVVSWTSTSVNRTFDIVQLSADYKVSPVLRVGALWGRIHDSSGAGQNASGGAIGAYYSLSKRTTLSALYETMKNDPNAGFRPAGSAGLSPNFTGSDVNGRTLKGFQFGVLHRF
ncbi:porin [Curvibacter cyanobacteriorum]|uniref:porin n=1 Tax=Curvibacter cyanobacteriorum TaxID=3026422 RepID=UPI00390804A6